MINFNDYGKMIRRYAGQGQVRSSKEPWPCSFECVQYSDARIGIACRDLILKDAKTVQEFLGIHDRTDDVEFTGVTDEGYHIEASSCWALESKITFAAQGGIREPPQLYLSCPSVRVTSDVKDAPSEVRFSLVNFEFSHTEMSIPTIPDGTVLSISRIEGYDNIIKALRGTRGVDVTCQAAAKIDRPDRLPDVRQNVEEVCSLLTLARGTRVDWINYDVIARSGSLIFSEWAERITKLFGFLPLIPANDRLLEMNTKCFVESAYPRLERAEKDWGIRRAIDSYTDAKAESGFLELRALMMVVCMEFLKGRYLSRIGKVNILPEDLFDGVRPQMESALKEIVEPVAQRAIEDEEEAGKAIHMMMSHVRGLNYYPFGRALSEMCTETGFEADSDSRYRFKAIRDHLVHYESFHPDYGTGWEQFSFLNCFVGGFLSSILGCKVPA